MAKFTFAFRPKIIDSLDGYNAQKFFDDLASGITVGLVALPLAMAFAIASGLKPEAGIFTAIFAGFIISALGGSRVQIGGPAGAFIVIVYGILTQYGFDGLMIATIMAGVILFAMGALKLGTLVRFVPVSIVIGFTNGIAILIGLSQVKDLLGLKIQSLPADFFPKVGSLISNIGTLSVPTLLLSIVSGIIVFGWLPLARKLNIAAMQRVPGSIIALVIGTCAVSFLGLPVETIGTRFGGIPSTLPHFVVPHLDFATLQHLIPPALTIAILGSIESLLCARVADNLINDRHNPNQELMAQGIANIIAPMVGGFCATGTIARTVTNVRSGGKTPIAGIIHALTLMAIILVAAPLAKNIPLGTLGAILIFVSYNMGEWHEFARLRHFPNNYRIVLLATFLLTVVVDLTVAVEVGLTLSCLLFITRISSLTRLEPIPEVETTGHAKIGGIIEGYRLYGTLFFGAVHKLEELVVASGRADGPKVIVLSFTNLIHLDSSGIEALKNTRQALLRNGCTLLIAGAHGQPMLLMQRTGFVNDMGADKMFVTTMQAFDYATSITAA